ncbi:MAG: helix-turn-helix transcriptional regulator [Oxalobacteraceae bacterium]|jgi:transcriptional regulator with XRE-family HTH domain|nr:helix-turn-helix transcriptional regulator [Oxalobacteraceae bacterium]
MLLQPVLDQIFVAGKALGMSQAAIARRAGLHPVSVSRMAGSGNARFDNVALLAQAVGLKITLVADNHVAEGLLNGDLF